MSNFEFEVATEKKKDDALHINAKRDTVTGYVTVYKFNDKDTKQFVLYAPSFEISGYGKTHEKALIMLKEALYELFTSYLVMSPPQLQRELSKLGWKQNRFRHKDFSKVVVK